MTSAPPAAPRTSSVVAVYAAFVADELAEQSARKASFEQRGLAVVTTSGGLVTLLFGLGALSTKAADTFALTGDAPAFLAGALVLFVLASVAALATNAPMNYSAASAESIGEQMKHVARLTEDDALRDVTSSRLESLRVAKLKNNDKAKLLFMAILLEVAAVAFVSAAIWIVLDP